MYRSESSHSRKPSVVIDLTDDENHDQLSQQRPVPVPQTQNSAIEGPHVESVVSHSDELTSSSSSSSSEERGPVTMADLIEFARAMRERMGDEIIHTSNREPSNAPHTDQGHDQKPQTSHSPSSGSQVQRASTFYSTHSSDDESPTQRFTNPSYQRGTEGIVTFSPCSNFNGHSASHSSRFNPEGPPDISGSHLPMAYESIEYSEEEEAWTSHCEESFAAADAEQAQNAQGSNNPSSRGSSLKRARPSYPDPDRDLNQSLCPEPLNVRKEMTIPFILNVPLHAVSSRQATIHEPETTHHENSRAASFFNVNLNIDQSSSIYPSSSTESGSFNSSPPIYRFEGSNNSHESDDSGVRRSKDLFGHNGILGRDSESNHSNKRARGNGLSIHRVLMSTVTNLRARLAVDPPVIVTETTARISIPREVQGYLYTKIEELITEAANHFLMEEYYEGNISDSSIDRVRKNWRSRARAGVPEFCFDQKTQYELIVSNREKLSFGQLPVELPVMSILGNWKKLCREMKVRTFNSPDSVIKKLLADGLGILRLLKAPERHLNEIATFHAIIIDKLRPLKEPI